MTIDKFPKCINLKLIKVVSIFTRYSIHIFDICIGTG